MVCINLTKVLVAWLMIYFSTGSARLGTLVLANGDFKPVFDAAARHDQKNPPANFFINCWRLSRRETPCAEDERLDALWRTTMLGSRQVGSDYLFTMESIRYSCLGSIYEPEADALFGDPLRQQCCETDGSRGLTCPCTFTAPTVPSASTNSAPSSFS